MARSCVFLVPGDWNSRTGGYLDDRRIEVHTQPSGPCESPAYASVVNYAVGENVPLVLDGVAVANIPVADLLP